VLVVNLHPLGMQHPKLKEVILADFGDQGPLSESLKGFDACFFCMGVSSIGMDEDRYSRLTYCIVTRFAELLRELNPGIVFNYVSGAGTDETERGKMMWARVKGRTENKILSMGFRDAYMFRPGFILPERGIKSRTGWIRSLLFVVRPFYPLLRKSESVTTTSAVGRAMINSLFHPQDTKRLEANGINEMAVGD
jgi:hypothetical protein